VAVFAFSQDPDGTEIVRQHTDYVLDPDVSKALIWREAVSHRESRSADLACTTGTGRFHLDPIDEESPCV